MQRMSRVQRLLTLCILLELEWERRRRLRRPPRRYGGGITGVTEFAGLTGIISDAQHGTKTTIPNAHHTPLIHDGFRAYLGIDQDIDDSVWTTVNLNVECWDDYDAFDTTTHKWTVPVDGTYFCAYQATFKDMEDGADVELCVRRSTPSPYNFVYLFYRPGGAGYMGMSGSSIQELVEGAEIYMRIYQNNTVNDSRVLGSSDAYTFLTVQRIK